MQTPIRIRMRKRNHKRNDLSLNIKKTRSFIQGSVNYVSGYCLFYCHHSLFWHRCAVCQGLWEVLAMLDIVVGLIGVVLIIYLLATVIRPELF
jgi:hypothetical protein